jgi:hypothetical protein
MAGAAAPRGEGAFMKPLTIVGIVLIVVGAIALAYQGITYTTTEKVVDIGPLKVEAQREKTIPLPPVLGGVAVAAGVILLLVGARGR